MAFILSVAFLIRLAAVLVIEVDPRARWGWDMSWYDEVARRLLAGRGYVGVDGAPTAHWPPGYPLLLAALYAVFGPSLLAAKLCNVLLGAAAVLLTFLIARELRRPTVGLVAAAILALFPGHVLFSPPILSEAFFGFLLCAALWAFLSWNVRGRETGAFWFGLGSFLGAMTLVRGIGLFLLPVFTFTRLAEGESPRATMRQTLAAAVGIVIVLVPWTVRNQWALGYPIPVATDGAISLWVGHSPVATGEHTFAMRQPWKERFGHLQALPNPQQEIEIARAEIRDALAYMISRPDRVVALVPAKVYHMYKDDRGAYPWISEGLAKWLGPGARRRLSAVVDGYYFAVVALALAGMRHFLPRSGRGAVALPITVGWFTLLHAVLFFGGTRFHVPLLPIFSLMAAAEIVAWVGGSKRRISFVGGLFSSRHPRYVSGTP